MRITAQEPAAPRLPTRGSVLSGAFPPLGTDPSQRYRRDVGGHGPKVGVGVGGGFSGVFWGCFFLAGGKASAGSSSRELRLKAELRGSGEARERGLLLSFKP